MTILPKTSADWERIIPLLLVLLASGVAWGSLKADVANDERQLEQKADAAMVIQQYQALRDAIQDVQRRLERRVP